MGILEGSWSKVALKLSEMLDEIVFVVHISPHAALHFLSTFYFI